MVPVLTRLFAISAGVEEYDRLNNMWIARSSMLTPRTDVCAVELNGLIYALGGASGTGPTNVLEVFDPTAGTGGAGAWATLAPMTDARQDFACAVLNGQIYAIGGLSPGGIVTTTEVYDPFTNTWSVTASLPTPRFHLAAAVLNGTIYTIGGDSIVSSGGKSNAVEAYGPTTVYTFSKN